MHRNTVYISGPITKNPTYMLDFERVEARLVNDIKDGFYDWTGIINPAKVNSSLPVDFQHDDYMEVCYRLLDLSNSIYLMKGWQESEGCRKELCYAKLLGLGVYYEELSD